MTVLPGPANTDQLTGEQAALRRVANGGRLRLDSPPGAGTTLEITLPVSGRTEPDPPL